MENVGEQDRRTRKGAGVAPPNPVLTAGVTANPDFRSVQRFTLGECLVLEEPQPRLGGVVTVKGRGGGARAPGVWGVPRSPLCKARLSAADEMAALHKLSRVRGVPSPGLPRQRRSRKWARLVSSKLGRPAPPRPPPRSPPAGSPPPRPAHLEFGGEFG